MASLPTITDLKAWLSISGSGEDTLLTSVLNAALEFIERYTGRSYAVSGDTTRGFEAEPPYISEDRRTLYLFHDLAAITSVTNGDGEAVTLYDPLPATPPYYALRLRRTASQYWVSGADGTAIAIVGKWGYSTDYPDDLWTCALMLAAHDYRGMLTGVGGAVSIGNQRSGMTIEAATIPPDILARLNNKRRR